MRNPIRSTLRLRRVPYGEHVLGLASAPVSVIEYGDFESQAGRDAHAALSFLMSRHAKRVRFVFRHFPGGGEHSWSMLAAEAAEAAAVQRNFWPFHDLLFACQGTPRQDAIVGLARQLGLDTFRFDSDLVHRVHRGRVREHVASGDALGIRQAPTFVVDGVLVDPSRGIDGLAETIGRALEAARLCEELASSDA